MQVDHGSVLKCGLAFVNALDSIKNKSEHAMCNSVSSLAVHDGQRYVAVSKYRLAGSSLSES